MLQSEETVHKQIHYHYQYYGVQKTFCIGTLSLAGAATSIIFVAKTRVCHDKTFVATKTILVAALTNDRTPPWEKSTSELFFFTCNWGKNGCTCFSHHITVHSFSILFNSLVCVFLTAAGDVGDVR